MLFGLIAISLAAVWVFRASMTTKQSRLLRGIGLILVGGGAAAILIGMVLTSEYKIQWAGYGMMFGPFAFCAGFPLYFIGRFQIRP